MTEASSQLSLQAETNLLAHRSAFMSKDGAFSQLPPEVWEQILLMCSYSAVVNCRLVIWSEYSRFRRADAVLVLKVIQSPHLRI
jgi:hypothetical protein